MNCLDLSVLALAQLAECTVHPRAKPDLISPPGMCTLGCCY